MGEGVKKVCFCPHSGKTVGGRGVWSENGKNCPRSCLMHPRLLAVLDFQTMMNLNPYRISFHGVIVFATEFAFFKIHFGILWIGLHKATRSHKILSFSRYRRQEGRV